jgi:hypothetical protein
MPKAAVIAFLAVFALGIGALLLVAGLERRSEAFTLGVARAGPLEVPRGGTACQLPINVPETFDRVGFQVGTFGRTGPPLRVIVRDATTDRLVAAGSIQGGYPDVSTLAVTLPRVKAGSTVAVCVRNRGRRRIALYGNATAASRSSNAYVNGTDTGADISFVFTRPERASLLALVPDMIDHASVFHGDWIGSWTFWVLIAALLLVLPALLVVALRTAAPERA